MPTILVPAPPKSAFNKNRPVSDLLQHQLKHFQHIEARLPNEFHSNMTARDLHTENGAAKYIAHITEALKSLHQVAAPVAAPIPIRRKPRVSRTLDIAAAAAPPVGESRPSDAPHQSPTSTQAPPRKMLSSRPKRSEVEGPASLPSRQAPNTRAKHKSRSEKP